MMEKKTIYNLITKEAVFVFDKQSVRYAIHKKKICKYAQSKSCMTRDQWNKTLKCNYTKHMNCPWLYNELFWWQKKNKCSYDE